MTVRLRVTQIMPKIHEFVFSGIHDEIDVIVQGIVNNGYIPKRLVCAEDSTKQVRCF